METLAGLVTWLFQGWRARSADEAYGELRDQVVLVTGASSGIGRELVGQFFHSGAKVILASRSTEQLEALKEELLNSNQTQHPVHVPKVLTLDLEKLEQLEERSKEAELLFGRVDILVNCGGMSVRGGALETSLTVHRRLMNVNYFGAMQLSRHICKGMVGRGSGILVNISSIQGRIAIPHRAAYAASKHALQAFSDSLRAELSGSGVTLLVVSPGYVNTDLSKNSLTAGGDSYGKLDQTTQQGYSVEYVGKEVIRSILNKDNELVLAPLHHRLVILLRALLPSLYFYIMQKRANKDAKKE